MFITNTKGYRESLIASPQWISSYRVLEALIKKFNVKVVAEIGVARGHLSAHLLEAVPDLRLYSVDPWGYFADEYDNMYGHHTLNDDEMLYNKVCEFLKPFGARSIILRATSERATELIKEPLDMVYLDGDHSYEGYLEDLHLWWNEIKVGGIFSGRDYQHSSHPGINRAVDEFFNNKGLEFNLEEGRVWWLQKPEKYLNRNDKKYNSISRFSLRIKRMFKRLYKNVFGKIKFLIKKIPGAKQAYFIFKNKK